MKLLFIRHGDPDYEKDSLTEKGWHEAELLMNLRVTFSGKVKGFRPGAEAKASLNRA